MLSRLAMVCGICIGSLRLLRYVVVVSAGSAGSVRVCGGVYPLFEGFSLEVGEFSLQGILPLNRAGPPAVGRLY